MKRIFVLTFALMVGAALAAVPVKSSSAATAGDVTGISRSGNVFTVDVSGSAQARITMNRADIFRVEFAPGGDFVDPTDSALTVRTDFGDTPLTWSDAGDYYRIDTSDVTLRVFKSPLRFAAYRSDNATLLWEEAEPLSWSNTSTTQSLTRSADEQFYGTGLRLGEWALRDKTVPVAVENQWQENTNASPAPYYMSTNGYGVMRNTWAPGTYAFTGPSSFTHEEERFDAYYFVGSEPKDVLGAYTDVTGKPFLAPIWGLELGNADCWNASNPDYTGDHDRVRHQTTPDVVGYAADARAADMPSGWFLPNDGYGCGYTDLPQVVDDLADYGFRTGLWTSTGLNNIDWEVGAAGSRGVKTDVAWVGGGYEYAFNAVQQAVDGIETNSDARRFVWTVDGWAGTHRNAVVWTGDTHGRWSDMRWHVPAIAGAGLSGFNYATGDVDGIYGGSGPTYVRDLQWKAFLPAFMTMSGWGATNPEAGYQDKQPWRWSEPYLSINRKYLKLKMRLMPYHYTMSRNASETGVPATRALVLEYPDDPVARGNQTSGQFMAGDSFLVAPVVSDTDVRDGIYLPEGTWTDYWTGEVYQGPGFLNGYDAPLDTLPLFVKGGAIVPMWPEMNYTGETPVSTLTYDIYPRGDSSFTLYEDDGLTRDYQNGAYATQDVGVTAPTEGSGDVAVTVGASTGDYDGKLASRNYELSLHVASAPSVVSLSGGALQQHDSQDAYRAAGTGWYFDGSVLWVKTGDQSAEFVVTASDVTLPVPSDPPDTSPIPKDGWSLAYVDSEETTGEDGAASNAFDGDPDTIWHSKWYDGSDPLPHEIQIDLGAEYGVDSVQYTPRQDGGVNGRIGQYEVYVSESTDSWGEPVATGTFADSASTKTVAFSEQAGRYLRLRALTEAGDRGPWTSVAELSATGAPAGDDPLPTDVELVHDDSGRCVDLPYGSTSPGTEPTPYSCNGTPHQAWSFQDDGTLTGKNGVCLDNAGTYVDVQSCSGAASQQWQLTTADTITSAGQCLMPNNGDTSNGTKFVTTECTGSSNQRWSAR